MQSYYVLIYKHLQFLKYKDQFNLDIFLILKKIIVDDQNKLFIQLKTFHI